MFVSTPCLRLVYEYVTSLPWGCHSDWRSRSNFLLECFCLSRVSSRDVLHLRCIPSFYTHKLALHAVACLCHTQMLLCSLKRFSCATERFNLPCAL